MRDDVFVLDIGTRTVIALIGHLEEKGELFVSHLLSKEHKTRAMLDGQIHDVDKVAEVISELVQEMQEIAGVELHKVAVAAAGRSLMTVKGVAKAKYSMSTAVTKEEHVSLQLEAVQDAQMSLPKNEPGAPLSQQYYCVGYSIVEERLDKIRLSTIVGQKGQVAEIEVIATFLPRIVVDSLQSAVEHVGLELDSITLEPIAVANLVLNSSMRRLNLVLVDIGAGTSDIAICGGDSISAFGMVPMAGDEVTEAISDTHLLDFNRAEEVKRQLNINEEIRTIDVLGVEQVLSGSEIKRELEPVVDCVAAAVAQEIYNLNNKAPQAILLVGGGSLTPGLPKSLAKAVGISESRVVVQQAEKLQHIRNLKTEYSGPLLITALGIAYTALTSPTMGFITVTVNDVLVKLLNLSQNNVAETLLGGGYNLKEIYGKPGLALTCEINGKLYSLPGKPGSPGRIYLNDRPALFSDKVKDGDIVRFEPGTVGENGQGKFRDILKDQIGQCIINGKKFELNPVIMVGKENLSLDEPIQDGCKAKAVISQTIGEVLKELGSINEQEIIWVNKKEIHIADMAQITKNGKKAALTDSLKPGDHVTYIQAQNLLVEDFFPVNNGEAVEIYVNGSKIVLKEHQIWVNSEPAELKTTVKAGDKIEYIPGQKVYQPLLLDIFKEIDFSPTPPPGKSKLKLMVNGEEKEYTYALQQGDKVKLSWV